MDSKKISDSIKKVLDACEVDYSEEAINVVMAEWYRKKRKIIEMLKKHPNWDDDAMAIVSNIEFSHKVSIDKYKSALNNLVNPLFRCSAGVEVSRIRNMFELLITMEIATNITERMRDVIICTDYFRTKPVIGQKFSRFLSGEFRVCDAYPLVSASEYEKLVTDLGDALSAKTVTRKAILSVHPCDFLYMSNGGNYKGTDNWTSCHRLTNGEYRGGTLSYMLDGTTMIFFTVEGNFEKNDQYCMLKKMERQLYFYNDSQLVRSRLYPYGDDIDMIDNYSNIVVDMVSACEDKQVPWIKSPSSDLVCDMVRTVDNALHYPDYNHPSAYHMRVFRRFDISNGEKMLIGHHPVCLVCGGEIDCSRHRPEATTLICNECSSKRRCSYCGDYINSKHKIYTINGRTYCSHCARECAVCGKLEIAGDMECIPSIDGSYVWVCRKCAKDIGHCTRCGSRLPYGSTCSLCADCISDVVTCKICGNYTEYEDVAISEDGTIVGCINCMNERNGG